MAESNPFGDEWRECLRAHYTHVVRVDDRLTEKTLRGVLLGAGFEERDLESLYLHATMRADDLPADFVPDLDLIGVGVEVAGVDLAADEAVEPGAPPAIVEAAQAAIAEAVEALIPDPQETPAPDPIEMEVLQHERDEAPRQLSLF